MGHVEQSEDGTLQSVMIHQVSSHHHLILRDIINHVYIMFVAALSSVKLRLQVIQRIISLPISFNGASPVPHFFHPIPFYFLVIPLILFFYSKLRIGFLKQVVRCEPVTCEYGQYVKGTRIQLPSLLSYSTTSKPVTTLFHSPLLSVSSPTPFHHPRHPTCLVTSRRILQPFLWCSNSM